MFKNLGTKKIAVITFVVLALLNFLAFSLVKQGIAIFDQLEHAEGEELIRELKQKSMMIDVFASIIITLDVVFLLLLLFFLIKKIFKSLKSSKTS